MKQVLLTLLILLSSNLFSQVTLGDERVDEFTKVRNKTTNLFDLAPRKSVKGVVASFDDGGVDNVYIISFINVWNIGCGGAEGNYITFLFEDGTTITYREDIAKLSCKDYNESRYRVYPEDFIGKKIVKFRVKKTREYDDFEWYQEQNMIELLQVVGYELKEESEVVVDTTSS